MKKRRLQNCLSLEKRTFESNIKMYRRLMNSEDGTRSERIKIQPVPLISERVICVPELDEVDGEEPIHQVPKNADILELLQQLVEGQNDLRARLERIEYNQSMLSSGQGVLLSNQEKIANKLETVEETTVSKPEIMAQAKLLMECKVGIKRTQESILRMTGEMSDSNIDEVASMLPLRTVETVKEVEEKLNSSVFAQAMNKYVYKIKGVSEDVGIVIRSIFTDDVLSKYNWDGRCEKLSLAGLNITNKVLRNIFQKQSALEFEKSIKKVVERAHHRSKQKKYLLKEKPKQ